MTELSAHLVDSVLPIVPVRQWVLTLPVRLRYDLAWNHDGTTHLAFEPLEFMEKLAAIIPRPRVNQLIYQGVLGARAKDRAEVVEYGRSGVVAASTAEKTEDDTAEPPPAPPRRRNYSWAELMTRALELITNCTRYCSCIDAGPRHAPVSSAARPGAGARRRAIQQAR